MAEYRVELTRRILAAFPNLRSAGYLVGLNTYDLPDKSPYENSNDLLLNLDTEDYGKSPLGSAYWDHIKIKTIPANPDEGSEEYEFPNDPLVDVHFKKKFTETEVFAGASVIEAAGTAAGEFRIKGVLWNNDGLYPEDQLSALLNVFRQDAEIEVVSSRYFNAIDVDSLFIESVRLPGVEGYNDSQPFDITARELQSLKLEIAE